MEKIALVVVGGIVGGLVGFVSSYLIQEKKLKKTYQTEDNAEAVVKKLMNHEKWKLRSFMIIRHHLGGFTDDELRKLLVRSGAIRFMAKDGSEFWGLVERNPDKLETPRVNFSPRKLNEDDLFK